MQSPIPTLFYTSYGWDSSVKKKDLLQFTMQEFSMVGGYMEDLKNHKTVKIGGWPLVRGWALAWDNTLCILKIILCVCS